MNYEKKFYNSIKNYVDNYPKIETNEIEIIMGELNFPEDLKEFIINDLSEELNCFEDSIIIANILKNKELNQNEKYYFIGVISHSSYYEILEFIEKYKLQPDFEGYKKLKNKYGIKKTSKLENILSTIFLSIVIISLLVRFILYLINFF